MWGGILVATPGLFRSPTRQRPWPAPFPSLYCGPSYRTRCSYCNIRGWYCCTYHPWRPGYCGTQTTVCPDQHPSVAREMELTSQWTEIHSHYIYAQTIHLPSGPNQWDTSTASKQVKYLGVHLDRRLTWRKHIASKRRRLDHQLRKLYWITGRKCQLSVENKLLLCKAILKPIWTYWIQLWGTASTSNIEILERFQAKALRVINDAPRYIPNAMLHRDLRVSTVKHTVKNFSITYHRRIAQHPNLLTPPLIQGSSYPRWLKRKHPMDLPTTG